MNDVRSGGEGREPLKERLISAAEAAVVRGGLDNLRVRDLARDAGCAVGAVYTAFADLDALLLVVNSRTLTAIERTLVDAAKASDTAPASRLAAMADAYFDFACDHRNRWEALFNHRMAQGRGAPDWFLAQQAALFALVEEPVGTLCPDLSPSALSLLARSVFSAVHGVVVLGLGQRLVRLERQTLREEVRRIASALAHGLAPACRAGVADQ